MSHDVRLSERQIAVCGLLVAGATTKEISRELEISIRTVRFHLEGAARRIRASHPSLTGNPKRIICRYFVATAGDHPFTRRSDAA